jgi:DNA adenine methylase
MIADLTRPRRRAARKAERSASRQACHSAAIQLTPPIKWHGGKGPLARRIAALMPPHLNYVEPYAGALSVLLARDPEGVSEVVNDVDGRLMNLWRVLREPASFDAFHRLALFTPVAEPMWREAALELDAADPVRRAWAFFVHVRQSLAGRMKNFTPISTSRTRRGMNEQASAWLTAIEGLPAVHDRLRRVLILNRDALEVIRKFDGRDTLFYLDPPYVRDTRTAPDVYTHEMTHEQHRKLLALIKRCRGKVMISGYRNELYDQQLSRWTRHEFDVANHAAGGDVKRRMTEVLWCNFATRAEVASAQETA